jgi:uncharacterized protein (DUF1330 family)
MMSDEPDVIEGKWSDRLVVMKFPDDVRKIRWASSTAAMILVPGFDPAALAASISDLGPRQR